MPKTRLISPGSIPNHKLLKNLQLQGNYISNDGGDEGITVDDAGDVGINIPTTITPATKLEVFNSNVQYSTGTAYQSGTAVAGSGTTFTTAMIGGRFVFDDGTDAGIITGFSLATIIQVSTSQTVGASDDLRAYKIYYPAVQIDAGGSGTELKIGNTSFNTSSGDILLAAGGGGDIQMSDGTNTIFNFDVNNPSLTIKDDADTTNNFSITVGDNGATQIKTVDASGASAFLNFTADGYIKYSGTFLWLTSPLLVQAPTLTASGTTDYSLKFEETLNLDAGAGGSDVHYGLWYVQTQTDLTGWDSVYLMYLDGGTAAKSFVVQDDGNVGIGVTDPDVALEVLSTSTQLKLSYDTNDYFQITVGADGHTTLRNQVGVAGDINIEAKDDLKLKADVVRFAHGDDTAGYLRMDVATGQLDIENGAGNAVIVIDDGDRNLYFFDKGGEYIASDGTNLTVASGGNLDLAITGEIDFNTTTAGFTAQTGTDAVSIDWGEGNKYHLLLETSSTVTFATNPTNPCNLLLKVQQGNGGSKEITWAVTSGDIYWPGGGITDTDPPTLTTADDETDILSFYFDGTNYFGVASLGFDTPSP